MFGSRRALRLRGLLLAALYLALPAGVFGVRPCAHHDGATTSADSETDPDGAPHAAAACTRSGHAAQAGHGAHTGHAGHAAETGPGAEYDHGHEHGGCACIGACSPAGAFALPEAGPCEAVAGVEETVPSTVSVAGDDVVPSHLAPHVLPWALPPPVIGRPS